MIGLLLALAMPALGQSEVPSWQAHRGLLRQSGLAIFFATRGPLSYQIPTPANLPAGAVPLGEVRGEACQRGLSVPLGFGPRSERLSAGLGKGGFEKALADIRRRHPDLRGIYDAKVDDHIVSILTVYQTLCTVITARGFR